MQLPFAGIENFVEHLDDDYTWTCGKGVYAEPVAEMALTLGLAGLRNVGAYAQATTWSGPAGRNLLGGRVTILGGGGITESLVRLLQPWDCHITVVRNHAAAHGRRRRRARVGPLRRRAVRAPTWSCWRWR